MEVSWQQPLKTRAPVAGLEDILRVQGHTEVTFPDVPPFEKALAAHLLPQSVCWSVSKKPVPPPLHDRETLLRGSLSRLFLQDKMHV